MEQKLKKYDRKNAGITLIALIITIIVMLILVGVTISLAVNGGLFDQAGKAVGETKNALRDEHKLANGDIIDYYLNQYGGKENLNHSGIIPEGATYKTGYVYNEDEGYWDDSNVVTLTGGQAFPETVEIGDIYNYGDYEYCYGYKWGNCCDEWSHLCGDEYETDGWAVRYVKDLEKPGVILESINGENIKSLRATFAFSTSLVDVTGIQIPNSATDMYLSFEGCTGITDISGLVIPSSVTDMMSTFEGCTELTGNIVINADPENYYDCFKNTVKPIGISTTNGACTVLEELAETANNGNVMVVSDPDLNHSVIIPEGATYITGYIFNEDEYYWDDSNVITLTAGQAFPETIEMGDIYNYGDYEYCYGWEWCTDCCDWSHFCGCEYETDVWEVRCMNDVVKPGLILKSINSETITRMSKTFAGCIALSDLSAIVVPSSVTNMGGTFYGCTGLTDISGLEIPNSVTDMNSTFYGCTGLTDISGLEIPNSVTDMSSTFYGCTGLTDISGLEIPNSVTSLGYSFYGCTGLTDISELVIPNNVTSLNYTFYGCTKITDISELVIPNSVTDMRGTFSGCTGLTDISGLEIPNSVKDMGSTFSGCTGLTDINELVISNNVTSLDYTFYGCTKLTDISELVIPNSVTNMGGTFSGCTGLTDISGFVIPSSVMSFSSTFKDCTGLSGKIIINSVGNSLGGTGCFMNVDMSKITLAGSAALWIKYALADTGLNSDKVTIIN